MEWLEPRTGLSSEILFKIEKIKKRRLFYKLAGDSLACCAFFILGAYTSINIWQALSTSAFQDLLALVWSDLPVVMTYWQDFSYAVLEILPVTTMALFGTALFMLLFFVHDLSIERGKFKKTNFLHKQT